MDDIQWYGPATLARDSHVYCAGTLSQCIRRWLKLSSDEQQRTVLRMGRDGVPPQVMEGPEIAALAEEPGFRKS
jgi:hypothetical protein